ncbi:MAG: hypothetical protein GQ561_08985, partial [Calditrichae bacterium]|nr:hypothetical protein [Calditrichia bacterium]
MENTPKSRQRSAVLIAGSTIVAVLILYLAFFYPWPGEGEVKGTIGAVEKYRSDQISEEDVILGNQLTNLTAAEKAQLFDMLA